MSHNNDDFTPEQTATIEAFQSCVRGYGRELKAADLAVLVIVRSVRDDQVCNPNAPVIASGNFEDDDVAIADLLAFVLARLMHNTLHAAARQRALVDGMLTSVTDRLEAEIAKRATDGQKGH